MRVATDDEIAEVAFLTSYTARWSAILHALQYNYDTFTKVVHQISEHAKKGCQKVVSNIHSRSLSFFSHKIVEHIR